MSPTRVLIVRLSALGDCVHVLPALDALRRGLGERAHIGWLVEERAASLLENHPQLDRVHVLPRHAARASLRAQRPVQAFAELGRCLREVRREKYDTTIDFHGNLRASLAAFASGASRRIGFARGHCKEGSHAWRTLNVVPPSAHLHKVEKNLALVAALGLDTRDARPVLALPASARERAREFFDACMPKGAQVIALHPGVSRFGAFKQWSPECFATLARRLAEERGLATLVTWGPGEQALAESIVQRAAAAAPCVVAPATGSLLELAALYERCDAVVGCDTGPLHLAAALDVPVIALFGPKDPALYAPWSARDRAPVAAIWKQVHCSPCKLRWCGNVICMRAIEPDDVLAAVGRLTDRAARTSHSARRP